MVQKQRKSAATVILEFNGSYPVGSDVVYRSMNRLVDTKVAKPAFVSAQGKAMVFVEGMSAPVLVDQVTGRRK